MRKYRTNNRDVCIGWGHRAKLIFSDVSQYTDSRGREEWIKKETIETGWESERDEERKEKEPVGRRQQTSIHIFEQWIEFELRNIKIAIK